MKTIVVCQLNHLGYFVGTTEADESPLEPGEYHMPAGCVDIEPPEFERENQVARLVDGAWLFEDTPDPESEEPEPVPDDAPLTAEQVAANRRKVYAVESDPLKIEAEYDAIIAGVEPDYTAWLAKVDDIKNRHPMPDEAAD